VKADWREPAVYAVLLAGLLPGGCKRPSEDRVDTKRPLRCAEASDEVLRSFIQVCANTAPRITATPR